MSFRHPSIFFLAFAAVILINACGNKAKMSSADLPRDILGVSVGMNKDDARKRLEEIAVFERDEPRNQQVWKMKDNSRFGYVAVGYDKENQIRYVTAIVDKDAVKQKIRFSDVGDISTAKQEIVAPHHRYIWEVAATDGKPAYFVNIYGDNAETVTIYSLSKKYEEGEQSEEEESEDNK